MAKSRQGKKKVDPAKDNQRLVAENRKARHKFEVIDSLECGICLVGSEVKSLRQGRLSLDESYARVKNGEVWLIGVDIQEYNHANRMNHDPKRTRKLLMHRREVRKFAQRAHEDGLTLVPLRVYFRDGRAQGAPRTLSWPEAARQARGSQEEGYATRHAAGDAAAFLRWPTAGRWGSAGVVRGDHLFPGCIGRPRMWNRMGRPCVVQPVSRSVHSRATTRDVGPTSSPTS